MLSVIHPCQPMERLLTTNTSTSTTGPLLPLLTPDPTNCSNWDQGWGGPYLHRLAHLDVQLYQDFYAVWVSLMVRQIILIQSLSSPLQLEYITPTLRALTLRPFLPQVCNCLMLVVGVVLNSLALYVFCGASSHSSASVVYTINLAVADLLVALSLPARIALYHSGGKCVACSYVHTFSYFVNMYCSILFLTRWALHHFTSSPSMRGKKKKKKVSC